MWLLRCGGKRGIVVVVVVVEFVAVVWWWLPMGWAAEAQSSGSPLRQRRAVSNVVVDVEMVVMLVVDIEVVMVVWCWLPRSVGSCSKSKWFVLCKRDER